MKRQIWDQWNNTGGPKYPHEKVIQYCFRNYPQEKRSQTKVLDLGCGSGVHTAFLALEGFKVTGIDISETGIANTKKRIKDIGLHADLQVLSVDKLERLKNDRFDLIVCVGVIECTGPKIARKAVEGIKQLLNKRGKGIFIFAGHNDFRVKGSNNYNLHGYTSSEVYDIFYNNFKLVYIDRYITTYNGEDHVQFDWLVTIEN